MIYIIYNNIINIIQDNKNGRLRKIQKIRIFRFSKVPNFTLLAVIEA